MANSQNLLDLLDRPNEPIFMTKGDRAVTYNVPDDYLDQRFQSTNIANRFGGGGERVNINRITLPDFSVAEKLGKRDHFSLFIPYHRRMAKWLIDIFMGMRNRDELLSAAAYARSHVNSQLYNYAFSVAILHRPDTKSLDPGTLVEYFPDKYMDGAIIRQFREEAAIRDRAQEIDAIPLEVPLDYTGSDLEPEHRVAYFREDLGINLHHWHWHLVYPFSGPDNVVRKDRRGELFYYMHQQLIARYNFERFSNRLPRVTRFLDLREPIAEAYFPKLDSLTASRVWAARSPNTVLRDISRDVDQLSFDIQDLERWRARLYEAVHTGSIVNEQGDRVSLNDNGGIDILGNLIEASDISMNRNLYGDLHNLGHVAISLSHDPDHRHLETFGVMGDSATAMRDPIFYRWHAFIDDIFTEHKSTLQTYTPQELGFNNIRVQGVEITSERAPPNTLTTFWQQDDVNLVRGMDFAPRVNVFARFTHLQHEPFQYRITVNNGGQQRRGTVRIFIAPRFDERGLPFLLQDQRRFMVELDKFVADFRQGQNVIPRRSDQSSVTIPFERTFRNLNTATGNTENVNEFNYCGCGWPQHMLIPKGSPEGLAATLFVMISDYQVDRVQDQQRSNVQCRGAISYCGIRDSRYPDSRPMGYPFDRLPGPGADTLQQFLTPNMGTQQVSIVFRNRIDPPGARQGTGGSGPTSTRPPQNQGQRQKQPSTGGRN